MFVPQVIAAIAGSLLGARLAARIGIRPVCLLGLSLSLVSMVLLLASAPAKGDQALAYPMLLVATTFLGAGFGLTVPVLNTYASAFRPAAVDTAVLTLNALLGLGTVLAPVFVAVFVGLGLWWGLPATSAALLVILLLVSAQLPLRVSARSAPRAGAVPASRAAPKAPRRPRLPARFWLYAGLITLYGICETMNGNWSQLEMTGRLGASAGQASLALAAFWGMVTAGRVLFAVIERWLPARVTYRLLPLLVAGSFLLTGVLSRGQAGLGILAFAVAGLGCSALLPLTISFGEKDMRAESASVSGGIIAFYQVGYGIAAFSVGPLLAAGLSLSDVFRGTAAAAAALAILAFIVAGRRPARGSPQPARERDSGTAVSSEGAVRQVP
jgi:predicted MFS family arabinose efflux permease